MGDNLLAQLEHQIDQLINLYQSLQEEHQALEKNYRRAVAGIKQTIDRLEKVEQMEQSYE